MKFLIPFLLSFLAAAPAFAAGPLANAANQFGLNLFGQLRSHQGNLFFSPYSVDTAMLLVRAGAAGQTAQEMDKALHLPAMSTEEMHKAAGGLIASLQADPASKGYELRVADALWVQKDFRLLPAFTELLQSQYQAAAKEADFKDSSVTASAINAWVAQQTHNRVKDLLQPGAISSSSRLALINAVYFKGDWNSPFNPKSTRPQPWHLDDGNEASKPAEMMQQRGNFLFYEDEHVAAMQMPYKGDRLALLALLPKDTKLGDWEAKFSIDELGRIVASLKSDEVSVSFPKFTMHDRFDLTGPLGELGLKDAFSDAADFSKMDGRRDLTISKVIHAAFVKIDETGTEAAGATGAIMRATAVRMSKRFNADHPFLMLIRDLDSGTILFMGRVSDPTSI